MLALLAVTIVPVFLAAAFFVHRHYNVLPWANSRSAHRWLYLMPLTRLGDFAAGLLLARLFRTVRRGWSVTAAPFIGLAGAVATVVLMCSKANLFSAWSWDSAYLVPALAMIWGLAHQTSRRWLASGAMVAAGEASYAFYLIHHQIMFKLGAGQWGKHGIAGWNLAWQVLIFFVVLATAIGIHRMVERPARSAIRRYI